MLRYTPLYVPQAAAAGITADSPIASAEAFGTAKLSGQILPTAIAGLEAFGTQKLTSSISPTAIPTEENLPSLAADFDGSQNTQFVGALTGQVDGPKGTLSAWVYVEDRIDEQAILELDGPDAEGLRFTVDAGENIDIFLRDSIHATLWQASSASALSVGWHHVFISWDFNGTPVLADQHIYIDGVSSKLNLSGPNGGSVDYTPSGAGAGWFVGTTRIGPKDFEGSLYQLALWIDRQFDPTTELQHFRSDDGDPVQFGSDGTVDGSTPIVFFHGPIANWHENKGSGGQTWTENGIINEAIGPAGTHQLNGHIALTAIASAEAFGSAIVGNVISPSAIASAEIFGAHSLDAILLVNTIASAEAFGSMSVTGAQIVPGGIASLEAIGSHTVSVVPTISPTGLGSAEAFGAGQVNIIIDPSAIVTAEAFGVVAVNARILISGIATAEAIGAATVTAAQICPPGLASAEAIGSHTVSAVPTIGPTGVASAEAFGTHSLDIIITAAGIAGAEAFGAQALAGRILVTPVTSGESFPSPTVTAADICPVQISSAEAFGTPQLNVTIDVSAILSGEAFGTPSVALILAPSGAGVEWTLEDNKLHYTVPLNRLHWTLPKQ